MSGGQTVGRQGGQAISRDLQREQAAAAAETRAKQTTTRGQVGGKSKMKPQATQQPPAGRPGTNLADPRAWD